MHRKLLLNLLIEYKNGTRITQEELPMLEHTLAFIKNEPNCFERTNLYGHITGSAFILNATHDAALLMHHKKLDIWVQLGGHADGDNDVARVALREAEEESGIFSFTQLLPTIYDLDVHIIPARKYEPEHFHFDIRFLFEAPLGTEPIQNEESNAIAWIPQDEIKNLSQARSVLRLVEKWRILNDTPSIQI